MRINWSKIFIDYFVILITVVVFSSILSLIGFDKLYRYIFKPVYNISLLTIGGEGLDLFLGGFLLSYALLLPLISTLIINNRKWLPWMIFIIPFLFFFLNDSQWILYFIILTILGGLIGWLINLVYKKVKKQ